MLALALAAFLAAAPADAADWSRRAAAAEAAGEYPAAASWYARIVSDASNSFFARRARSRLADLKAHADYGYAPYARFEALKRDYQRLGSEAAVAEARAILEAYPDAAVAPEVRLWLGNEFREVRRDGPAAVAEYRALVDAFPASPLAPIALDRIGRLHEAAGRFAEAEAVYAELARRFPESGTPAAFAARREAAARGLWRKRAAKVARGVLAFGGVFFVVVGGWRIRPDRLWRATRGPLAFALLLGLAPATFLYFYDGLFSPSLSTVSVVFGGYAFVLGALAARRAPPAGRAWAAAERVVFGAAVPLALLTLIVHHYRLWEAFGL